MYRKMIQIEESVYQSLVRLQGQYMIYNSEQLSLSETINKLIQERKDSFIVPDETWGRMLSLAEFALIGHEDDTHLPWSKDWDHYQIAKAIKKEGK